LISLSTLLLAYKEIYFLDLRQTALMLRDKKIEGGVALGSYGNHCSIVFQYGRHGCCSNQDNL